MRKVLQLLLASLLITNIQAQNKERDSLKALLQNEQPDTVRIKQLAELSNTYIESNTDSSLLLALEALSLSQKAGYLKGEAVSLSRIASAYGNLSQYSRAMKAQLQSLKINEEINNPAGKVLNIISIGVLYRSQEDYETALEYFNRGKILAENIKNNRLQLSAFTNLGLTYLELKQYDSASLYTQQAYLLAIKENNPWLIGASLSDFGKIHFSTGKTMLALEYYRSCIPYIVAVDRDVELTIAYLRMANVFEKLQQKDSALHYAHASLSMAKKNHSFNDIRDAARFLSASFRKVNPDSAFYYQDITKSANDSISHSQKRNEFQTLAFEEKLRQHELQSQERRAALQRKHNLQYAAIALGLVTFIILFFLLSHSIIANQKAISFLGILALLIVFEFLNLLLHPFLDRITNHQPVLMLAAMVCIAALLIPLHHKLEHWITHKMVEKNNRIRLASAKKTIAQLEGTTTLK